MLRPPEEFTITAKILDGDNAVVLGGNRFEVLATKKEFTTSTFRPPVASSTALMSPGPRHGALGSLS